MFHFPSFPPHALCVQAWVTGHDSCRVSPFGHPRISALLAAPRGFSQPHTSFFGSWCQGIHRAPLLTWPQRCSRPLCSSQATGGPGSPPPPSSRHSRRERVRAWSRSEAGPRSKPCGPIPQDPTACLGRRPLSTPVPATPPSRERRCCTRRVERELRPTGQCSTHELCRGTIALDAGLDAAIARDARCSLERR